jgi:membrane fusion protein, multidrug efflux system
VSDLTYPSAGAAAGSPGHGYPPERRRLGAVVGALGVALVAAAMLAVLGIALGKRHALQVQVKLRSERVDKGPIVHVTRAEAGPATRQVQLTADVRGYFQTTMYAKISGYLKDIRVDKGDRVSQGQILGTVESPETDQALASAEYTALLQKKLQHRADVLAPDVLPQTWESPARTSGARRPSSSTRSSAPRSMGS